jgi:putative Mg2+ transporter-C (MgtC) family protein
MEEFINEHLTLAYISWGEMLLRVFLACLFGLVFGLERDTKNKPVNFRVYMIVAMTSCIVAILGQELGHEFAEYDGVMNMDLGKVISGTLTGIGFLGAGAILKVEDTRVVGTATGASVWAAGGIGLAIGFGYYALAIAGFFAVLLILILGGYYMKCHGQDDVIPCKDDED